MNTGGLMAFVGFLLCFTIALALFRSRSKTRRLTFQTWNQIAEGLRPTNLKVVETLARRHLQLDSSPWEKNEVRLWHLLGGIDGISELNESAKILIELASYAHVWAGPESTIVAQRMRRDAIALRTATTRCCMYGLVNAKRHSFTIYAHEAAGTYWIMRNRLISLYENCPAGPFRDHLYASL